MSLSVVITKHKTLTVITFLLPFSDVDDAENDHDYDDDDDNDNDDDNDDDDDDDDDDDAISLDKRRLKGTRV